MHFSLFFGALACFAFGLIDDLRPIDAKLKFIIQILIAFYAHQSGFRIDHLILPILGMGIRLKKCKPYPNGYLVCFYNEPN